MIRFIPIQMVSPDEAVDVEFVNRTGYIKYGFFLHRDRFAGQIADEGDRDKSVLLWQDIRPKSGKYSYEIIVCLPFYLPVLQGRLEYVLEFENREYSVNNRHCEFISSSRPGEYIFAHRGSGKGLEESGVKIDQAIALKSLVSTLIEEAGDNALFVLEANYEKWTDEIRRAVASIVSSMRYLCDTNAELIADYNDGINSSVVYILCTGIGESGNEIRRFHGFSSHIKSIALRPLPEVKIDLATVNDIVNDRVKKNISFELLIKGNQLFHSGEYELSAIVAISAAEISLSEIIRRKAHASGMALSRDRNGLSDITLSQMLQVLVYFVIDMRPNRIKEIIGNINALRKLRNEIAHGGKKIGRNEMLVIQRGIKSIEDFLGEIKFQKLPDVRRRVPISDRFKMISEAAYFISAESGFSSGHEDQDWSEAERQIDRRFIFE